jgi:hypothetical protein
MRNLAKIACAVLLLMAGLSAPAFSAGADTEKGQTPAAPSAAGADNQPNKPPTPVMTNGAKIMSNGANEEEKKAASENAGKEPATPGTNNNGSKP